MYNRIEIIQGDTYETTLEINGLNDLSLIKAVTITSEELGICKDLTYNADDYNYSLKIPPEETTKFPVGRFDYDITIKFNDSNVLTVIYQDEIIILAKKNRCPINVE